VKGGGLREISRSREGERILRGEEDGSMLHMYPYISIYPHMPMSVYQSI
jgi:hypothetical protein